MGWTPQVFLPVERSVQSKSLVGLFALCAVASITYMGMELLFLHRHAEFKPARAFVNSWNVVRRDPFSDRPVDPEGYVATTGLPQHSHCGNASFDWALSPAEMAVVGAFNMQNVKCRFFDDSVIVRSGSTNEVAVATNVFRTAVLANGTRFFDNAFTTQVDDVRVNFQYLLRGEEMNTADVQMPLTIVYDALGQEWQRSSTERPFITLSVRDVLALAGFAWDTPQPQSLGTPRDLRIRGKGAEVAVRLRIGNWHRWELGSELRTDVTLQLMGSNWGPLDYVNVPDWLPDEEVATVTYTRYGLRLIFIVEGELGHFSTYRFVLHMLSLVVLFGVAKNVTQAGAYLQVICDSTSSSYWLGSPNEEGDAPDDDKAAAEDPVREDPPAQPRRSSNQEAWSAVTPSDDAPSSVA